MAKKSPPSFSGNGALRTCTARTTTPAATASSNPSSIRPHRARGRGDPSVAAMRRRSPMLEGPPAAITDSVPPLSSSSSPRRLGGATETLLSTLQGGRDEVVPITRLIELAAPVEYLFRDVASKKALHNLAKHVAYIGRGRQPTGRLEPVERRPPGDHPPSTNGAAESEQHPSMPMLRTPRTVLPDRTAELRVHHDHNPFQISAQHTRELGDSGRELGGAIRQRSVAAALMHVGVPARKLQGRTPQ